MDTKTKQHLQGEKKSRDTGSNGDLQHNWIGRWTGVESGTGPLGRTMTTEVLGHYGVVRHAPIRRLRLTTHRLKGKKAHTRTHAGQTTIVPSPIRTGRRGLRSEIPRARMQRRAELIWPNGILACSRMPVLAAPAEHANAMLSASAVLENATAPPLISASTSHRSTIASSTALAPCPHTPGSDSCTTHRPTQTSRHAASPRRTP